MVGKKSAAGILAILTVSHLAQHLYVGVSVLYPEMKAELALSYWEMGIVAGISSVASGFLQICFSIAGRYYPRRILLGLGNVLYSVSTLGMGLARSFGALVVSNLFGGIGSASQHPLGVSMLSESFSKSVARALGIFYGLGYLGNVVSPLFLTGIALVWGGWRNALLAMTIVPATIGLSLIFYLRGESVGGKSVVEKGNGSLAGDLRSSLRNRSALAVIAAQAFAIGGTGQGALVTYTPLFLKNGLGLDAFVTSVVYSIAMGGGIVGTVVLGRYADRIGHLRGAILCTGLSALAVFFLTAYGVFQVFLAVHLFVIGLLSFPIFSLMQAHLVSTARPSEKDLLMGLFLTLGFGFSALWSAMLGVLIDMYGSFAPVWLVMTVLNVTAVLFQVWAYRLSSRGAEKKQQIQA